MPIYVASTVNTQYKPGERNGRAGSAQFRAPSSLCEVPLAAARKALQAVAPPEDLARATAAVMVADTGNNCLRLLLLGSGSTSSGSHPGWWVGRFGPKTATLMKPRGICMLPDALLVCDTGHHRIRCMALDGTSSMPFAGSGKKGHRDGPVETAQFDSPSCVCVCPSDKSIIVADTGNNALRRIFKGIVYTLAGSGGAAGRGDASAGFVDGTAGQARFRRPSCVLYDREESLLVVDSSNHCVRVVSPDWTEVRTVAGGPKAGCVDGAVDKSSLSSPESACLLVDGSIAIADRDNNKIRRLSSHMECVDTLAGTGEWGAADGMAETALFNKPTGICCLHTGVLVIADAGNNCLRLLTDAEHSLNGTLVRSSVEHSEMSQQQPLHEDTRLSGQSMLPHRDDSMAHQPVSHVDAQLGDVLGDSMDAEKQELAHTRAMLDSSDSEDSDLSDPHLQPSTTEYKSAWGASRLIQTADRRLGKALTGLAASTRPAHQLPWDKPSSPDALSTPVPAPPPQAQRTKSPAPVLAWASPQSGRAPPLNWNTRRSLDDQVGCNDTFEIVEAEDAPIRRASSSQVMRLEDQERDKKEQAMEVIAYQLGNKWGSLRSAFRHMASISQSRSKTRRQRSQTTRLEAVVDGAMNLAISDSQNKDLVDKAAWLAAVQPLTGPELSAEQVLDVFRFIDSQGSGVIDQRDLEEALRLGAEARVERRARIAWAAQNAKLAVSRSRLEMEARDLLAGAEAALVMRDPVLAQRRLSLCRLKFQEAYKEKDESLLLDVYRELSRLDERIASMIPQNLYGHSMPTPARMVGASIPVTVNGTNDSHIKTSPSKTPIAATSSAVVEQSSCTNHSNISDSRSGAACDRSKLPRGVVYQVRAQLFRPTVAGQAGDECVYVASATLQVQALLGYKYGKETAQFKLSILTVPKASETGSRGLAPANTLTVFDSHPLDAQVKADGHEKSPFWLWLSWPQRADTPRQSITRQRYGLRFASARQAAQVQNIVRQAAMPEFQRPADSVLSAPNVADAYNKASLNASMMTSSPPPSVQPSMHMSQLVPVNTSSSSLAVKGENGERGSPGDTRRKHEMREANRAFGVSTAVPAHKLPWDQSTSRDTSPIKPNSNRRQPRRGAQTRPAAMEIQKSIARSEQELRAIMASQLENLEAALGAVDSRGQGLLTRDEISEALLVLNDMELLDLSHSDVTCLAGLAFGTASRVLDGTELVEVAGFIDQFRPGNSRARREWAGGAPPTVHELGLKQDGSDVADSSLVTSSAETSVLRQASDRSIIPAPTAVSTAVKVLKHTLGHSVSAWRDTSKSKPARLSEAGQELDVLRVVTKSNPNSDVLKSMTDSHRGRKAIRPRVEKESEQRGSIRQEARGNSKQSKSIQSPLDLDQLQMELEAVLSREQAKISSMTLGRHGFKGVKIGGQALEQVQVTTDIVRRAVSSLQHARLLKSRVEQLEQAFGEYEEMVERTAKDCVDRRDLSAFDATGSSGTLLVVIGGVRYVLDPASDVLRTVTTPHHTLVDRRLAVLREPFFARAAGQHRPGLQQDLTSRLRHVARTVNVGLSSSASGPSAATALEATAVPPVRPAAPPQENWSSLPGRSGQATISSVAHASLGAEASTPRDLATCFRQTTLPGGQGGADGNRDLLPAATGTNHSVDALLRMDVEACQSLVSARAYYKSLTSLLAPEALLLECQVADSLGVAAFCDEGAFFHVVEDASVWVRMTLWGFDYTSVSVSIAGNHVPLTGALKNDPDKHAHYVLFRISLDACLPASPSSLGAPRQTASSLPAPDAGDATASAEEAECWQRGLRRQQVSLGVEASVAAGGPDPIKVSLEGDLKLGFALCGTKEELHRYATPLKNSRRAVLGGLAAELEPLALLSARFSAKAAIIHDGSSS